MSDVRIDMDHLDELWRALILVFVEFEAVPVVDKALHDAVGHPDLAKAVTSFGDGWDARRDKLSAALDVMWQAAEAVHTNFREVDQELSNVLTTGNG